MTYEPPPEYEWDEAKSARNARERGLPFDIAPRLFQGRWFAGADDRVDYGELRLRATGEVGGLVLVCVYTMRGDRRRVISLRVANRSERHAYRAHDG